MTRFAVPLVLFLALASCGAARSVEEKNSPVTKVVTLLKDMMAQLEKEADEDEKVYEAMGCWCETNEKEKTKAIADAKVTIQKDIAASEEGAATSAQMNTDIAELQEELKADQEALETATALREKQLAEFSAEEKDMLGSIGSLKSAVGVLSKHHGSSFLQVSEGSQMSVMAGLRFVWHRHADMMEGIITPSQRRKLTSFVQESTSLMQPQSGEIFGVLKQMKETFETNLASSQKEETSNQDAYSSLKKAKEAEIAAAQSQIEEKTTMMAEAGEKKAAADKDKVDTEANLAADTQYLADLKEQCKNVDAEFEERTKTRQLEIQATSKALEILTSDEAHDLVARTLGLAQETFVQKQSRSQARVDAARALEKLAKHVEDPQIAMIASQIRLDAFGKVKQSIQDMVDKLLKEKEDDFAQKDFCVDELNKNLRNIENTDRQRMDAIAKAEDHATMMEKLTKEIEALKASVAEALVQIKKAGEEREKANGEYQVTVADQRATQKLLSAALNVLKGFYEKAALVQQSSVQQAPAGPPPPPGFKKYEKNAASGGVMGMIQAIVDDAKAMEAEAISGEEQSLQAYEDFIKDTNAAVESMRKDITAKTELHAKEEQDKVMEESNAATAQDNLDQLKQEELDLHANCDFLLKNFETRLEARDTEVEALKEALATFSGATFSAFMQAQW